MAAEKGRPYAGIFHDDYNGALSLIPDPATRCRLYEAVFAYSETGETIDTSEESPAFKYLYQTMTRKIDYQETVYKKKVEGGRKGGQNKAKKEIKKQLEAVKRGSLQVGWKDATDEEWKAIEKALRSGHTPARVLDAMRTTYNQTTQGRVNDRGAYMLAILENNK